jgi:hypothetical protein
MNQIMHAIDVYSPPVAGLQLLGNWLFTLHQLDVLSDSLLAHVCPHLDQLLLVNLFLAACFSYYFS